MSFWFRYRDRQGVMHEVSISVMPMMIFVAAAGVLAVILPLLFGFRDVAGHSPVTIAGFCVAALGLGFIAFAVAKVSVIRRGRVVSFGPASMSQRMRALYIVGYVMLALGASGILLLLLALRSSAEL